MKKGESTIFSEGKHFEKYLLIVAIILLVLVSYKIVSPYLIILSSSFILAYLFRPIFSFLRERFGDSISAIICLILALFILILPFAMIYSSLGDQAISIVKNNDMVDVIEKFSSLPLIEKININWESLVNQVGLYIFSLIRGISSQIPPLVIASLIFIFSFFYILKEWDYLSKQIKKFVPFKNKEKIMEEIDYSNQGIIFGYFFIAIIDFLVAMTGFYLAGVQFYLLLAFIMAVLVFVPGIGPSVISIPLLFYYAVMGNWFSFMIILALWVLLSYGIEIYLASKFLKEKTRIHPVVMVVGIFGGTALFGLFGFIFGPLILTYTLKIVKEIVEKN